MLNDVIIFEDKCRILFKIVKTCAIQLGVQLEAQDKATPSKTSLRQTDKKIDKDCSECKVSESDAKNDGMIVSSVLLYSSFLVLKLV